MRTAATALLAILLTAGCNSSSAAPPPSTPLPAAPTPPATPATPPATPSAAVAPTPPAAPSAAASAATASDDPLVGKPAPDFTATASDGTPVHLAALKGKPVVVYFYPKDETPGCTKEACSFRDAWDKLSKTGVVLVGVSADNAASHKQFISHWKLPFLLASDPDGSIGKLFGVPFASYHKRQTIEIGPDGNVKKVYRQVDVGVHAQQVLDDLSHAS
jgi:peroxiredoxin Q/BCP